MKRFVFAIAILVAACACTKEEISIEEQSVSGDMIFTATIADADNDGDTKAHLNAWNEVLWSSKDSISIMDANATPTANRFEIASGVGKTSATFYGSCPTSSKGYYAVYPYNNKTYLEKYSSGFCPDIRWDGAAQTAYNGSIDPEKFLMVAYGAQVDNNSEVNLDFKNVLAYLKFRIEYKCKSIVIQTRDADDYIACEHFEVIMSDDGSIEIGQISGRTNTITLTAPDGGFIKPGTYFIGVMPKTYSAGFSLTFYSSAIDGNTCQKSKTASCTFERNKIYNLGTIDISNIADLAGSGKEDDPYLITDFYDLKIMKSKIDDGISGYSSACYKQTKDIDVQNQEFSAIGASNYFKGTYDGGSHKISNIVYEKVSQFNVEVTYDIYAMFACIQNAIIKDLTIDGVRFDEVVTDNRAVMSPLVAMASSDDGQNTIIDCHVQQSRGDTLKIYPGSTCHSYGSFVAINTSDIHVTHCSSDINILFNCGEDCTYLEVGGIMGTTAAACEVPAAFKAGQEGHTYINECRNAGSITIDGNETCNKYYSTIYLGGILGLAFEDSLKGDVCTIIANCVNSARLSLIELSVDDSWLGGIVAMEDSNGWSGNRPAIVNTLSQGNLNTSYDGINLGGMIGECYDDDTSLIYCVTTAKTNVDAGYAMANRGTYTDCYTNMVWSNAGDWKFVLSLTPEFMNDIIGESGFAAWATDKDGNLDLDI